MSISAQLLDAIEASGLTLYRVAKDSGVSYSVLHRFVNGERQVKLDTVEKLTAYFSMHLTRPVKRKRPK